MFSKKLKEYLKKERKQMQEEHPITKDKFWVSEAGECPRKIYLKRIKKIEEPITLMQIFKVGNLLHKFVQENIIHGESENQFTSTYEYPNGKFIIRGKPDIILNDEVIELKTTKNIMFINQPRPEHLKQLNLYLHLTQKEKGKIIYINNHNLESIEFEVSFSQKLLNETLDKFKYIRECFKYKFKGKDVDCHPSPFCFNCKYKLDCFDLK